MRQKLNSSLLLVLLASALLGCGDRKSVNVSGPDFNKGDPSPPQQLITADLPKIQASAKFKVSGDVKFNNHICFSNDGKRFALYASLGRRQDFTQVWDTTGPKLIAEFETEGHEFALSPSGKFLFTGSWSPKVFNVDTKQEVCKIPESCDYVFFRNENIVVLAKQSNGFDKPSKGKIVQWDITKNADAGSFEIADNRFVQALPAKNGKECWLFMGAEKYEVECYDLETRQLVRTVKADTGNSRKDVGIYPTKAPDDSVFGSEAIPNFVYFDAETGKKAGELPRDLNSTSTGFIAGGNRYLARPVHDKSKRPGLGFSDVVIYDWKSRKALAALMGHPEGDDSMSTGCSPDGKTVITVLSTGEGQVFDISSVK